MQAADQTANPELPLPAFLRLPVVLRRTGLGRSTIYRMIANKEFPGQVRIGARAVAWRQNDIDEWIDARPSTH
ncbi:AlpA family transcriptional regulator [Pelomonas sp. Root1444]|uniref:helix-turn-helix transcriptional regulator n=1 Tax=Pelomonas sp. Root1444 TaxID=1736464 RepID=UPI0009E69D8C|nr:AlpA family transcriptional regulator [Pelomonas sp. Root1444]